MKIYLFQKRNSNEVYVKNSLLFLIKWVIKSNQKTKNFQSDSADKYYF